MRVVTAPQNRAIRAGNTILGRFGKNTIVLGPLLVLEHYRNEKDATQRNYFAYVVRAVCYSRSIGTPSALQLAETSSKRRQNLGNTSLI